MSWIRGRVLGRGSSATVTLARDRFSGEVVAVKSGPASRSELLKREQEMLSTLKCPQIVAYKGCDTTLEGGEMMYNLFMEYAPGGTLTDVTRGGGRLVDEAAIGYYARQILRGLQYLHSSGIVHCDIKGRNILVAEDGVRIADLGCAKWVSDEGSTIAGTPAFMAPEVARGEQQGFAADIWAFGCTVIEMATGRAPWGDVSDPVSALYRIGYSGESPEMPSFMSEKGRDFLEKCFMKIPSERWSAEQLMKHEFLEGPEFELKGSNGFDSDSPTGVLDRGLWDSMQGSETPTQFVNCPTERIGGLIGGGAADWEWDEKWVSVRSYEKEVEKGNEGTRKSGTETDVEREEDGNRLINDKGAINSRKSNVRIGITREENKGTFVALKCTKQMFICGNFDFEKKNEDMLFSRCYLTCNDCSAVNWQQGKKR